VDGRLCIDGGTIDNLPVSIAATGSDAIIAVDVGSSDLSPVTDIHTHGFASIYMRAASVMMHSLQQLHLTGWQGPPMILIRPRVTHLGWFTFGHTRSLIEEGYLAARAALEHADQWFASPGGVFPRRTVRVAVDRGRCTGCGLCASMAPHLMGMDAQGKAFARTRPAEWSPADGDFVHHCPTGAIEAVAVDSGRAPVGAEPAPGPIAPDDAAA
jgi:NTE family protein